MSKLWAVVALTVALGAPARGQMPGMEGMHHHEPAVVTPKARKQIDSVAKAIVPLGAPGVAASSGYRPVFGWIPTMGVHWVSGNAMMNGRQTNRAAPSQLMFSKVNGRDSLVGAAYAYITADNDTVRPVLFDGNPAWHEHPDLAPPGMNIVMLHVWFVPSPDGAFAGTNPNLPFWAVGLAAPDSTKMKDAAFNSRVRRAGLALGSIADSTSVLSAMERRPGVKRVISAHRDTVRTIIPELLAAEKAKDSAKWNRAADRAAKQWDAMYDTYLSMARTPEVKARVKRYVEMLLGQHGE